LLLSLAALVIAQDIAIDETAHQETEASLNLTHLSSWLLVLELYDIRKFTEQRHQLI
jgi:hypothetical protein